MITRSICNGCLQVYEISSESTDTHLLKEIVQEDMMCVCPRLCGGRINILSSSAITMMATDPRLREPMHLSAKELFKAVKGGGLPEEIPKSAEVVELLFAASKVKEVKLQSLGTRIFMHEIHFENGQILHLSSGLRGAEVLKITKGAP